ncbi:MAG: DUF6152 family protein [Vicinamibacterales bacterium]
MKRIVLSACLALALAATAVRIEAHHAFAAEFDAEKKVTLVGTVVVMEWVNPHAWLTIDVPDAAGKADRWQLEFGPPNALFRRGWRKSSLMPGMKVTASAFLAKDGRKVANADKVTLPDGKVFGAGANETGGPESAPK